ncbi:serine/threonine-protein kinase [Stigmatella sp. ncwal1]|uniref:Serine/threonine-protein kinase n=1 Tax=Stigmatella ashevillensis TaxID=2995309 RepID=A0ABT5DJ14_9BACT|nr:serine/threonine-protein kinase [Stigmatella ashevillena]MDC0713128.1 serine/threonine-protein kinase [Stigmatella ashevillena]
METLLPAWNLNPAFLLPGGLVGPWRVIGWRGQGAYGTVYQVERAGEEKVGPFALKLALYPEDERFEREAELLSRINHPHIPRLVEEGLWQHRNGTFPYLVMQWIEGVPLYTWTAQRNPSSRQVLTLLAQLARALAATDEAGGVHRDVKGANVLVRSAELSAVLMDFGAGDVKGTATITKRTLPPGTPAYRSPEAWAFERVFWRHPTAHYKASACDDLFALGITAYKLVTDEYPPPTCPGEPGSEVWREEGPGLLPPRDINPSVCPELDALILRLLAVNPSERFSGQPYEAAEALEQSARTAGAEADAPLFAWERQGPGLRQRDPDEVLRFNLQDAAAREKGKHPEANGGKRASAQTRNTQARALVAKLWLILPVVGLFLVRRVQEPGNFADEHGGPWDTKHGSVVATGDRSVAMTVRQGEPGLQRPGLFLDMPKAPLPGQRRTPCKPRFEIEIRGSCWIPHGDFKPPCGEETYEWRGRCFAPSYSPLRPNTSEEPLDP